MRRDVQPSKAAARGLGRYGYRVGWPLHATIVYALALDTTIDRDAVWAGWLAERGERGAA